MKRSPLATVRSAVRNSPEAFYLHLAGAQQGPYTIPQIDHLLNSGLIGEETLYWREGLDQWQPVISLVAMRKRARPWVRPLIILSILVVLAIPVWIFGPILADGWQEANQHDFTTEAAYWRARDVVRTDLRAAGSLVEFAPVEAATVKLMDNAADVELHGTTIDSKRTPKPTVWSVSLQFNREAEEWSGKVANHTP